MLLLGRLAWSSAGRARMPCTGSCVISETGSEDSSCGVDLVRGRFMLAICRP